MALYAMADLHLSFSTGKPMDIFGDRWSDHAQKIAQRWCLTDADTAVLAGDLSWAIDFSELEADLDFLSSLPGKKILLKGNHDYWWETMTKMRRLTEAHPDLSFVHNCSVSVDDVSVCGTRGWTLEKTDEDERVLNREVGRLRASLKSAEKEPVVFLHYPPIYGNLRCEPILSVLKEFGVRECYYGHLHGPSHALAAEGEIDGTVFRLISADRLDFTPLKIRD